MATDAFMFDAASSALVIIDMQRDFCDDGGCAAQAGLDTARLAGRMGNVRLLLDAVRGAGLLVVHTREGHLPDLSDCTPAKLARSVTAGAPIGRRGPMGRLLVRGEYGHDIIDALKPQAGEPIIDKPGYGAFHRTRLEDLLHRRRDHRKIAEPALRARYYDPETSHFGAPEMRDDQRIPSYLARLGLAATDIDIIFIGHLHFDHAGGLQDLRRCGCGAEIHVQKDELAAARSGEDSACFVDDFDVDGIREMRGEYDLTDGVRAIATPGHTAGHMSMWITLPKGPPVLLAGDAADLVENIVDEVASGGCWRNGHDQAVESIRKLKQMAAEQGAQLWPNHDMAFYRGLQAFPAWHE